MALVLIIDDNEALRTVIRMTLESVGHTVVDAGDGRQGMRLLASHQPDLLITDILMPTKEGLETIREARAARPTLSIMAISGGGAGPMNGADLLEFARQFGADAVLEKPFRAAELRQVVESLLQRPPD